MIGDPSKFDYMQSRLGLTQTQMQDLLDKKRGFWNNLSADQLSVARNSLQIGTPQQAAQAFGNGVTGDDVLGFLQDRVGVTPAEATSLCIMFPAE